VLLDAGKAVPIHEDHVWGSLSFTRSCDKKSSVWTGKFCASLVPLEDNDGRFLEQLLEVQARGGKNFEVDEAEYKKSMQNRGS
jgi:hypothetical protein